MPETWISAAAGTGSDDSTALDDAIAQAGADDRILRLRARTYKGSRPWVWPDDITVVGAHPLRTKIVFNPGVGAGGIVATSATIHASMFGIEAPGSVGITVGGPTIANGESVLDRLKIVNTAVGVAAINCSAIHLERLHIFNFASAGVSIAAPLNQDAGDSWLKESYIQNTGVLAGTGTAVYQSGGGGWKGSDNKFVNIYYGWFVGAILAGHAMSSLLLHDNSVEGCVGPCFVFNDSDHSGQLTNVSVDDNQGGSHTSPFLVATTTAGWLDGFHVTGNNTADAINVGGATHVTQYGNG